MLDTRFIGHAMAPFEVDVEASRLRFFARATGQTDPVYLDDAAARAAGHRALPVPPTFLFCLEMAAPDPEAIRKLLGLEVARVLHGEQHFAYHAIACAGDRLRFGQRIVDLYARKGGRGGRLDFVVRETRVDDMHGTHVADLRCIMVARHG